MSAQDDARALRDLAQQLGLRPSPAPATTPPAPPPDHAWEERILRRIDPSLAGPAPAGDEPMATTPTAVTPLRRRRRVPPPWAAAACAVVLLVLGGVMGGPPTTATAAPPLLTFGAGPVTEQGATSGSPARAALLAIAEAARTLPAPPRDAAATAQHVRTDQWRLEFEIGDRETRTTVRPTRNDSWLLLDGRVRYREVATAPAFSPDGRVLPAAQAAGDVVRDEVMSSDQDALLVQRLPHDPQTLTDLWLHPAATSADGSGATPATDPTAPAVVVLENITDLFTTWVVPPDVAATLWSTLAAQDGVRDLGATRDRLGRPGQGFAVWDEAARSLEILVVDPADGRLLGRESVLFAYPGTDGPRPLDEPVVGRFTTYVAATWTTTP